MSRSFVTGVTSKLFVRSIQTGVSSSSNQDASTSPAIPLLISREASLTGGSACAPGEETPVPGSSLWHLAMKAVVLCGAGGGLLGLWVFLRRRFLPQSACLDLPRSSQLAENFAVRLLGRSPGLGSSFQSSCSVGWSRKIRVSGSARASGVRDACFFRTAFSSRFLSRGFWSDG